MANPIKNEPFVCPKCGSDNTSVYDDDWDYDYVVRIIECDCCEHRWREYFKITYAGYADATGEYDENGVIENSYEDSNN